MEADPDGAETLVGRDWTVLVHGNKTDLAVSQGISGCQPPVNVPFYGSDC